MNKNLLLINDMAGYGKVALSAMIPVLSHLGHHIYNLPTALVSNTLDYGKFDILDTTDYMVNTIRVWEELDFSFDAATTGFIVSEKQAKIVANYCKTLKEKGALIFVDPIMGDEGHLYNGITENTIGHMKELVKVSDYIVPNYTEAACLAGAKYLPDGMSQKQVSELIEKLLLLGAKSIVVTSAVVDGKDATITYDYQNGETHILNFDNIPVRFPGTGDIFSSIFIGNILNENGLSQSTQTAMDTVRRLIELNQNNQDKYKGIPLESYLEVIRS